VANKARSFYQHRESVHCVLLNGARNVNILAGLEKMPPQRAFRPAHGTRTGDTHVLLYQWYELGQAAFRPARVAADSCRLFFNPFNPLYAYGRRPKRSRRV
jgi:hypothetical protein